MSAGWTTFEFKSTTNPLRVPRSAPSSKTWKTIATFDDLALGKTILSMELAGTLPSARPVNVKTEWVKAGGTDPSKRHGHEIGGESGWASTASVLEDISAADLPLELRIFHDGGSDLLLTKVIVKCFNPLAELRGKIDG